MRVWRASVRAPPPPNEVKLLFFWIKLVCRTYLGQVSQFRTKDFNSAWCIFPLHGFVLLASRPVVREQRASRFEPAVKSPSRIWLVLASGGPFTAWSTVFEIFSRKQPYVVLPIRVSRSRARTSVFCAAAFTVSGSPNNILPNEDFLPRIPNCEHSPVAPSPVSRPASTSVPASASTAAECHSPSTRRLAGGR